MLRLLIWGVLIYIGYRIVMSLAAPKKGAVKSAGTGETGEATHQDPVCGVYVSEMDAVVGRHDDRRYYFCSMNCLEKFRENLNHTEQ